jgi:hypothetical protein
VLLNGRRVANYGFAQNINEAFVDLNSIPITAIERIEILKDGASAIYGSDAIAGVMNVILRRDYQGIEVGAMAGSTYQGGGTEYRVNLTGGWGNPASDRWNIMGTVRLLQARGNRCGGSRLQLYREPGAARRLQPALADRQSGHVARRRHRHADRLPAVRQLPAATDHQRHPRRAGLLIRLRARQLAAAEDGTDGRSRPRHIRFHAEHRAVRRARLHAKHDQPVGSSNPGQLPGTGRQPEQSVRCAGHRDLPHARCRPAFERDRKRQHPRLVGLRGMAAGWDWETAYTQSKNEVTNTGSNYIDIRRMRAAINGGTDPVTGTVYPQFRACFTT